MLERTGGVAKGAIHTNQNCLGLDNFTSGYFYFWLQSLSVSLIRSCRNWAAIDIFAF
jgi:hypothetical protein